MTTEPVSKDARQDDYSLLRTVEQCNLLLVLLLLLGGWYCFGSSFALSALIGGALSGSSFFVLKRTLIGIVNRIGIQQPTAGFAVKFYIRLLVLVLVLAALSMSVKIHLIGLIAGLSTVMVSVILVVLVRGLMELSGKHVTGV